METIAVRVLRENKRGQSSLCFFCVYWITSSPYQSHTHTHTRSSSSCLMFWKAALLFSAPGFSFYLKMFSMMRQEHRLHHIWELMSVFSSLIWIFLIDSLEWFSLLFNSSLGSWIIEYDENKNKLQKSKDHSSLMGCVCFHPEEAPPISFAYRNMIGCFILWCSVSSYHFVWKDFNYKNTHIFKCMPYLLLSFSNLYDFSDFTKD